MVARDGTAVGVVAQLLTAIFQELVCQCACVRTGGRRRAARDTVRPNWHQQVIIVMMTTYKEHVFFQTLLLVLLTAITAAASSTVLLTPPPPQRC